MLCSIRELVRLAAPRALRFRALLGVLVGAIGIFVLVAEPARGQSIAWTQHLVSGPSPRYGHAMAYDSARGVTVLFGGTTGGNETWEWNGAAWTQRFVSGPSPRQGHMMSFDTARGVIVLFGGYPGVTNHETWEWNGSAWTLRAVINGLPSYE